MLKLHQFLLRHGKCEVLDPGTESIWGVGKREVFKIRNQKGDLDQKRNGLMWEELNLKPEARIEKNSEHR